MNRATQSSALQTLLTRTWMHRGWLAWTLLPFALFFGGLSTLRRRLYQLGWFPVGRVPVPIVVVGNVVAGGTGKTPVVIALVQHLQSLGLQVGVVSRGYGRTTGDCREVHPTSAIEEVGDEPALIKRKTSAKVFVARQRLEAARLLLKLHPQTQIIVSDDGLQHLALQHDIEICVFDDRGTGNSFLQPAGPLREPWPRPVDLVLHTGTQPAFAGFSARRALANYALRADGRQVALADLMQSACKPLLAVAAIAKPDDFFGMLQTSGLRLTHTLSLPDHFNFADWSTQEYRNCTVLCTEKDAIKLWLREPEALAVPLQCSLAPDFLARFDQLLSALPVPHSK